MAISRKRYVVLFLIIVVVWIYVFTTLAVREISQLVPQQEVDRLAQTAASLEQELQVEREEINRLKIVVKRLSLSRRMRTADTRNEEDLQRRWPEPIPVLVFACNRPQAVENIVKKLLSIRPSEDLFPITVSQDCDDANVRDVVAKFRNQVNYIKHKSAQEDKYPVPKKHKKMAAYYYISRHYKLALQHIFDKVGHSSAILLEDDLDVSSDFFEYFSATRYLLDKDEMLFCISAWNDNGKGGTIDNNAHSLLYRSDFFPGLGWMMTSKLWDEVRTKWPPAFWDDWLREPENRKGRQCIRPEISRTKMTVYGKHGASKGLFFEKYLAKVVLNTIPVNFTSINLDYLLNPRYDAEFNRTVYKNSQLMSIDDAIVFSMQKRNSGKSVRVEYTGNIDYIIKADKLQVMHDFKAGVPRTAYQGVVTSFLNGVRVFLVPDRNFVKGYDKTWEVPRKFDAPKKS